jgi:hypothetical protein
MASNGKAATGTVFPESFVLHENSTKLEVGLGRMETIGHLEGQLQTVRRGNAAFPRLAVECSASPWAEAGAWIPGFVTTATAVHNQRSRTQMANRSRTERSVVIMHATQVVRVHGLADSVSQELAGDLIGSKMYPTVNTRVGDVVGNLLERRVLQHDVRHVGI